MTFGDFVRFGFGSASAPFSFALRRPTAISRFQNGTFFFSSVGSGGRADAGTGGCTTVGSGAGGAGGGTEIAAGGETGAGGATGGGTYSAAGGSCSAGI